VTQKAAAAAFCVRPPQPTAGGIGAWMPTPRKCARGPVRTFAQVAIPTVKNPWPETLLVWVGRFDRSLQDDLRDVFDDDDQRLRRELGLLVDRRNKIAHGLNEGITERKALNLQVVACEIADWFVLRFNPQRP